ncbi:hypothetical protein [Anaerovibrio sp. RM50]|uniref:hypothetical protein n=1 Tax=Anaerovibrio sp. RM50 TaxID=1200557 RepID=UPI0004859304|nr:hypothetical protein [Anaerovibrio sp. RM50]
MGKMILIENKDEYKRIFIKEFLDKVQLSDVYRNALHDAGIRCLRQLIEAYNNDELKYLKLSEKKIRDVELALLETMGLVAEDQEDKIEAEIENDVPEIIETKAEEEIEEEAPAVQTEENSENEQENSVGEDVTEAKELKVEETNLSEENKIDEIEEKNKIDSSRTAEDKVDSNADNMENGTLEDKRHCCSFDEENYTEINLNTIEENMRVYEESGDYWVDLYTRNPLIGNALLPEERIKKLYSNAQKAIKKILDKDIEKIPLEAEMKITFVVINIAKTWDTEDNSSFWDYIISQFGYRDTAGILRNKLQDYVKDAVEKNNRWFIQDAKGDRYKSTIVAHALATKSSWKCLYDFLFDFYQKNLGFTYDEGDPTIFKMIKVLREKFISGDTNKSDNLKISSKSYKFQEGIRKLVINKPGYSAKLFLHMLRRIDALFKDHIDSLSRQFYVDELCDIWWNERISDASESTERKAGTKKVAIDYDRIRPFYSLCNEKDVKISFPDIRLKKTDFADKPESIIYIGDLEIEKSRRADYGDELGKTIKGFDIKVNIDDFLIKGDGLLRVRIVIKCDEEVIYDSKDSLYRDLLCFSGEKECKVSDCKNGDYLFICPAGTTLDIKGADFYQVSAESNYGTYYASLKDDFVIILNEKIVASAASNSTKSAGVSVIRPNCKQDISYIFNGNKYSVISELDTIAVKLDKTCDYQKYRFKMNGEELSSSDYITEEQEQNILCMIPLVVDEYNICNFEVVDLVKKIPVYSEEFRYEEYLTWTFDKKVYYSSDDYKGAKVTVTDVNGSRDYGIDYGQEIISVSAKRGMYEIKIPRITVQTSEGKVWGNDILCWIKELEQSRLSISYPNNCSVKLFVGDDEVSKSSDNTYDLTCDIHKYKKTDLEEVSITLRVMVDDEPEKTYCLIRFSPKERFAIEPKFEFKDGSLYWNRGGKFIGSSTAKLRLVINGEYNYPLKLDDDFVAKVFDIPIDEYNYIIIKKPENIFQLKDEEIAEGTLKIGDENELRFKGNQIKIKYITDEQIINGPNNSQKLERKERRIKKIYIDHLKYIGIDNSHPIYSGIMYFINKGRRCEFSYEEDDENDKDFIINMVNPVKVEYIDENYISVKNENSGGFFYYLNYNQQKVESTYRVTAKEPKQNNKKDKDKYRLIDLYIYEKEKIKENV